MFYIKTSRFNVYFDALDGTKLAFNSLTCGLAVVDDTYTKLIDMLPDVREDSLDEKMKETYQAAQLGHFIVPDDFDELLDYCTKRNVQKYSLDSLGLTIAPTLACNFKCVYCYETSKPGFMSEETQNSIIQFVSSQSGHLKNLDVTWYGGEPLLAQDTIASLSEHFLTICSEHNIQYSAFIISNGSLITDDVIAKMKEYHIQGIQITIDGPQRIHDSRRISKNGTSSFQTIITNINKLLDSGIDVVLRINIDKTNESTLDELIGYLEDNLVKKDIKISFGQVTAYTEACRSIESSCYNNSEFADRLAHYYKILQKHGFQKENPFPYPNAKLNYCCAELLNSYVVDHEGYLYKCWNEVGNTRHAIGNINDPYFDLAGHKNGSWIGMDPLQIEECKNCNVLPLCVGGCPFSRRSQKQSANCDLIKYNIKDVMLTYYNYAKEGLL